MDYKQTDSAKLVYLLHVDATIHEEELYRSIQTTQRQKQYIPSNTSHKSRQKSGEGREI
jgi:hypothetical protein